MLRFLSIRLSSHCLLKRALPLSTQQQHISSVAAESTTPKKVLNVEGDNHNEDLSFPDPTTYNPLGNRTFKQKKTRRIWTEEDDKQLKSLYAQHGPRYTFISRQLPGRSISSVFRRCKYFFDPTFVPTLGKWQKEELTALRTLVEEAIGSSPHQQSETMIDWRSIQQRLPYPRELHSIKMAWYHSLNPKWQRGRWTVEETNTLHRLVQQVGINDWQHVSTLLGTRSPRQCLEKYRHQIAFTQKGRFTPKETAELLAAVNTYGAKDFLHIQQVMSSTRTPRQLSKYYRYALDPAFDRSTWTMEEKRDVYRLTLKFNRDMLKVREHMNSKRRISDMWNHFNVYERTKATACVDAGDQRGKIPQSIKKETNHDTETEQGIKTLPETVK